MKRRTLRPAELRAGRTFFIGYVDLLSVRAAPVARVEEFLVTSRRGYWPSEGEVYPYALRPELVAHIGEHCVLWRTRRDAQRYADQAVQKFNSKHKAGANDPR